MIQRLLNTFTNIPEDLDLYDVAKWAAIGGLSGLGLSMHKKNQDGKFRLWPILTGIGLGGYGKVLSDNIVTELGGHFKNKPLYYNYKNLLSMLNPKNKEVVFYVDGAKDNRSVDAKTTPDVLPENTFVFKHGDEAELVQAIKSLPSDVKLTLVGHSSGGGTAIRAAEKTNGRIDKLVTLDPVDLNPLSAIRRRFTEKRSIAKDWVNVLPKKRVTGNEDWRIGANKVVMGNPLRLDVGLTDRFNKARTVFVDDDHGMLTTGLRRLPVTDSMYNRSLSGFVPESRDIYKRI